MPADNEAELPECPDHIDGYQYDPDVSWWGKPVNETGQIYTFGNKAWETIFDFTNTMNGCDNGLFLMHWHSMNGLVQSAVGFGLRGKMGYAVVNASSHPSRY